MKHRTLFDLPAWWLRVQWTAQGVFFALCCMLLGHRDPMFIYHRALTALELEELMVGNPPQGASVRCPRCGKIWATS